MPKDQNSLELGKSLRQYDQEKIEDEEKKAEKNKEILKWMIDAVPELERLKSKKMQLGLGGGEDDEDEDRFERWIDAGNGVAEGDPFAALNFFPNTIPDKLKSITNDMYYAFKDGFSGRKMKTSAFIASSIGVGAAIGALVGTVALPGIGTALGGAGGALIAGATAFVGGIMGCIVLGAFAGSWIGAKMSDKLFKHEKHYELSKRITKKVKSSIGLDSETSHTINDYLYNRAKQSTDKDYKSAYKALRKGFIEEANPEVMIEMAYFFSHELKMLREEMNAEIAKMKQEKGMVVYGGNLLKLENDLKAVTTILEKMQNANSLSKRVKAVIEVVLSDKSQNEVKSKLSSQTIEPTEKRIRLAAVSMSKKSTKASIFLENAKENLVASPLKDLSIIKIKPKGEKYPKKFIVKDKNNKEICHFEMTKEGNLHIAANKQKDLASQLFAAALRTKGVTPFLDEKEFGKVDRNSIVENAKDINEGNKKHEKTHNKSSIKNMGI